MNQLEALTNACKYSEIKGLMVEQIDIPGDKVERFRCRYQGTVISPVLSYDRLNHFILGIINFKKYIL